MHTIMGFNDPGKGRKDDHGYHGPDNPADIERQVRERLTATQQAPRRPKTVGKQNLTMGTVTRADLGGKKLNPYVKQQSPPTPSQIVDRYGN